MSELINFVSDEDASFLAREEPDSSDRFIYTRDPQEADWHVVLGSTRELRIPNSAERTFFVVQEPPEIRKFDHAALALYGAVLSPPFRYLRRLDNLVQEVGLLPWRVGISIENPEPTIRASRADLEVDFLPTENRVSVVTSGKSQTRQQIGRLRLIEYLMSRLPELEVYGRDSQLVQDKAEALKLNRFHIALENSSHLNYWTEKLTDPILMQTIVFYSGRNGWQHYFRGDGAILEIDVNRPKLTYELIRRTLDSCDYGAMYPTLRENKNRVLRQYNLHQAVLRTVRSTHLRGMGGSSSASFRVRKHRRKRYLPGLLSV